MTCLNYMCSVSVEETGRESKIYNLQITDRTSGKASVTSTKTIAVSESVWERLRERMKREQAKSLSEVVARLLEETGGVPSSRFGVHKRLKVKFTQEEHEEITKDLH